MDEVRDAIVLPEDPPVDGTGVRVAVLDTGVDPEHPDLEHAVSDESCNFCPLASDVLDRTGHGTHVAGIIAGNGAASDGRYRGIAPGVELIALKVLTNGRGYSDTLAKGVLHAIDLDVDIINYSGGQNGYSQGPPPWKWPRSLDIRDEAFALAGEKGILCLSSAGNAGPTSGTINKPAIRPFVLGVGALTTDGENLAEDSSRGPVYLDSSLPVNAVGRAEPMMGDEPEEGLIKPDLVAPGGSALQPGSRTADRVLRRLNVSDGPVSCRSSFSEHQVGIDPSDPDCPYTRIGGTSQATAVVTGIAALLIELGRKLDIEWGDEEQRGVAMRRIIQVSAASMASYESKDVGHGAAWWPKHAGELEDFAHDDTRRRTILDGPQIELME